MIITRRRLLGGIVGFIAAPAVVKVSNIMNIKEIKPWARVVGVDFNGINVVHDVMNPIPIMDIACESWFDDMASINEVLYTKPQDWLPVQEWNWRGEKYYKSEPLNKTAVRKPGYALPINQDIPLIDSSMRGLDNERMLAKENGFTKIFN